MGDVRKNKKGRAEDDIKLVEKMVIIIDGFIAQSAGNTKENKY